MEIGAIGQGASVRASTDVFATDVKDGQSLGKAKQTAAEKSSLWVTYGEKNHAAGVFAKTTPKAQSLEDRLCHMDGIVSGEDLRHQNGVPVLN